MKHSFEYFLNAIHYCLWLGDMKFGDFVGAIVNKLLSPIPKYLFTKEYKKKYEERLVRERKNIDRFFYDKKSGYHIGWANHWFGYFYAGYPLFVSFVSGGFLLREYGYLSTSLKLIILIVPVGLCYIPAYKAVFAKDRYLKYFKQFEKQDENWHKRWKKITLLFCIGSVLMFFISLGVVTLILS